MKGHLLTFLAYLCHLVGPTWQSSAPSMSEFNKSPEIGLIVSHRRVSGLFVREREREIDGEVQLFLGRSGELLRKSGKLLGNLWIARSHRGTSGQSREIPEALGKSDPLPAAPCLHRESLLGHRENGV